eukprot:CAMPEP_0197607914 /NCGR_PEP_ID=MMETSP1326-20131121/48036_1 /TAXON_ID=1155430 /ORGANISM="Genus nov. species nov., Strain RCC2288" /LENGTH=151 /DNA_ID=CAMNT_0043176039 /DNA_START=70 /DNA_END=522 /DNA_ORIENTATION=-
MCPAPRRRPAAGAEHEHGHFGAFSASHTAATAAAAAASASVASALVAHSAAEPTSPSVPTPLPWLYHEALLTLTDPQVANALSGAGAGGIAAAIVCPLDVLKTRLQVSTLQRGGNAYMSTYQSLAHIVNTEGVKGLYRGLTPTLVALLPNW